MLILFRINFSFLFFAFAISWILLIIIELWVSEWAMGRGKKSQRKWMKNFLLCTFGISAILKLYLNFPLLRSFSICPIQGNSSGRWANGKPVLWGGGGDIDMVDKPRCRIQAPARNGIGENIQNDNFMVILFFLILQWLLYFYRMENFNAISPNRMRPMNIDI